MQRELECTTVNRVLGTEWVCPVCVGFHHVDNPSSLSPSQSQVTLSLSPTHTFMGLWSPTWICCFFYFLFFGNKKLSTCDFSTQCLYLWPPIRKVSKFFSFSCSCYPIFFPISFWLFILFVNVGFGLCKSKHIVPSCFFFFSSPDSNFIYYDLS